MDLRVHRVYRWRITIKNRRGVNSYSLMDQEDHRENLVDLLRQAGKTIIDIYHDTEYGVNLKADESPVTRADLASDSILKPSIEKLTGIPVISEESLITDWEDDHHPTRFWLLDPMDGTREFIAGNDEFCISLAMIENGQAVEGYILSPVTGELWYARSGEGAFKESREGISRLPVYNRSGGYILMTSRSHHGEAEKAWLETASGRFDIRPVVQGSAIKFGRIAEGSADLNIKKGKIFGWDAAAGAVILRESGGGMMELGTGREIIFKPDNSKLPHFLAYGHRVTDPGEFIF